jgi:hypothetical protein
MLKGLVAGIMVLGIGLGAMAATKNSVASDKTKAAVSGKAKVATSSTPKEFTFKGKIEADKIVFNNANAKSVVAKVVLSVDGKAIASVEKVALKQSKKNAQNWSGSFEVKGKVAEKAKVKVAVTAVASFEGAKPVNYAGEQTLTTGSIFSKLSCGTVTLTVAKTTTQPANQAAKKK